MYNKNLTKKEVVIPFVLLGIGALIGVALVYFQASSLWWALTYVVFGIAAERYVDMLFRDKNNKI